MSDHKERITYREAAKMLGLCVDTVSRYANRGWLGRVIRVSRNTVFLVREDLENRLNRLAEMERQRNEGEAPITLKDLAFGN